MLSLDFGTKTLWWRFSEVSSSTSLDGSNETQRWYVPSLDHLQVRMHPIIVIVAVFETRRVTEQMLRSFVFFLLVFLYKIRFDPNLEKHLFERNTLFLQFLEISLYIGCLVYRSYSGLSPYLNMAKHIKLNDFLLKMPFKK